MTELIIMLIISLVSYFGSKKAGASDGQAALAAVAAGAGTYYATTQTDWGKDMVKTIDSSWTKLMGADGAPVLDGSGNEVLAPAGAVAETNPDGSVKRDEDGNVLWKLVDSTGKVLTSWGPAGTAAVVGTSALVANDDLPSWVLPVGLGVLAFVLLK